MIKILKHGKRHSKFQLTCPFCCCEFEYEESEYGYCWALWLNYVRDGKEFKIALPCYKNANKDNYKSLSYSIATVDSCSYTTVFSTRFLSELKDGVTKFLNGEI
jgi:hypothetical protein